METIEVLRASIDLEHWIVQFGTFAVGYSEEPSKVLIFRYVLEPKGSLAQSGQPVLRSIGWKVDLRQTNSTYVANNRNSLMQSGNS